MVYGNYNGLKDVVYRLVDNAIQYTPQGSVTIQTAKDGDVALFSITDTGIGIPGGIGDKIFEPLGEIYKTNYKLVSQRTGLSLAICKIMIEHHGGKIWFESQPDQGSTFSFTLPRAKP